MAEDHKASGSQRVYTYRDADGNVYYSFHQARSLISPPIRLKLKSRIGVPFALHLSDLRRGDLDGQNDG